MGLPEGDDARWKIEIYKDKLRYSLAARFALRFHVTLILFFAILVGWMIDLLLLKAGVKLMLIRFPLATCAAYGGFLLGVYVWTEYSGIRQYIKYRRAHEIVGDDVPRAPLDPRASDLAERGVDVIGCLPATGEGCLIVGMALGVIFLVCAFFGGFYAGGVASLFAEIVVEMLLAAGLLKGVRQYESAGWINGVVTYTYPAFIAALIFAAVIGSIATDLRPNAHTLPQALGWQPIPQGN